MGYAIRDDQQGWRSVDSAEDLIDGEYYSETPIEIMPPTPTYQSELAELNSAWQIKVDQYNKSFALAALSDGPSEESKKTAIRIAYEADKVQSNADRAALKVKYGIGGV
jgi:hypothetical protein